MVDPITFFKGLGVTTLFLLLILGIGYWFIVLLNKFYNKSRFFLKYKVFRRKYKEEDVKSLMDDLEHNVHEDDLLKAILLSGLKTEDQAKELVYIYKQLKKVKGGVLK